MISVSVASLSSPLPAYEILEQNKVREGLVVDLGCGSGLWAQELTKAHYSVFGVDMSKWMIGIAQRRVPDAEFRIAVRGRHSTV